VEAATFTPRTSSSPCTRRYPQPGFSRTSPQHQGADRVHDARPARVPGPGPPGVPACDHIAVPAEDGLRAHHHVQSPENLPREPVQQRGQQGPVGRGDPHPVRTELPLQDRELVAQREDLRVFVLAAHRQQPQQREHVRHTEVDRSQQHDRSTCHGIPSRASASPRPIHATSRLGPRIVAYQRG
jgi:hypothetical protein